MARLPEVTNEDLRILSELADEHVGYVHSINHRLDGPGFSETPSLEHLTTIARFSASLSELVSRGISMHRLMQERDALRSELQKRARDAETN